MRVSHLLGAYLFAAASQAVAMMPNLPKLPKTCPNLITGDVSFTPEALGKERKVRIWQNSDHSKLGPLVFFFHGMGGSPDDAKIVLGEQAFQEIIDAGGMVVAPHSDGLAFAWYLVLGTEQDDLFVADDVVSCAVQNNGIDPERIYATGFSAGALHVSQMAFLRSDYLASAVIYSGGFLTFKSEPKNSKLDHKFPLLMYYGGANDFAFVNFRDTTMKLVANLKSNRHPYVVCNHNKGHKLPNADGIAYSMEFLSGQIYGEDAVIPAPMDYCEESAWD